MGVFSEKEKLVFQTPPENFNPKIEVAACFINVSDRVLFLKRVPSKTEGNLWGIPGGKLEKEESPMSGVVREVLEETTIQLKPEHVKYFGKVYIRYPHIDFIYHMFEHNFENFPKSVTIDENEHSEYRWITLREALEMPLIPGEDECIYLAYGDTL